MKNDYFFLKHINNKTKQKQKTFSPGTGRSPIAAYAYTVCVLYAVFIYKKQCEGWGVVNDNARNQFSLNFKFFFGLPIYRLLYFISCKAISRDGQPGECGESESIIRHI